MHEEIKTAPGMFWCLPHGAEMPVDDRSPDPRYCKACWAVIQGETAGLKPSPKTAAAPPAEEPAPVIDEEVQLPWVDGVTPKPSTQTVIKRAIVEAMTGKTGKGTRTIAAELKAQGINVSHMKVSRIRQSMRKREPVHA